tara:strand:+ start:1197 stop:1736 length:540 start_codon:yes stop_codon:yes gene_type:complete
MDIIPMTKIPAYVPAPQSLTPWQQLVVEEVGKHEEFVDSESAQLSSDYALNKASMIQVSLRAGSGHTFLAAHFAKHFNCTIVYFDVEHYKEMEALADVRGTEDNFHENTYFVSIYELRHDIILSSKSDWIGEKLNDSRKKFKEKSVVVVDRATEVREKFPEIIDFICQVAQGAAIVLLG